MLKPGNTIYENAKITQSHIGTCLWPQLSFEESDWMSNFTKYRYITHGVYLIPIWHLFVKGLSNISTHGVKLFPYTPRMVYIWWIVIKHTLYPYLIHLIGNRSNVKFLSNIQYASKSFNHLFHYWVNSKYLFRDLTYLTCQFA